MAVSAAFHTQLKGGPCSVYSSDLKVRVSATGLASHPDVTVVCGPVDEEPRSRHVVLNPTIVVEVTSSGTEEWDRGDKLEHYQKIPALQACIFVSPRERRLEAILRQADGSWTVPATGPGQALATGALGCVLAVDDIYANLELAP